MKASAVLIFIFFSVAAHSQTNINNYKYVLVPEKFDFSKETNQYNLNNTTVQLLEQKGFVVFMANAPLPQELAANRCNALKAEVTEKSGMFVTGLTLLLKDCQGNIIYKTKQGKSREKDYALAYDGALRDAFTSLTYKYDSTPIAQPQQFGTTPAPTSVTPVATAPAPSSTPATTPATASPAPPTSSTTQSPASTNPGSPILTITGTLYAQTTPNGYQLIDTTPKKILTLLKTSVPDYYIAEAGPSNGIVFKKNGEWLFEHYENNKLVSQKLDIKF